MLKFSKGHIESKKGGQEEHFCEIILKSDHWPRRRCSLMLFFFFLLLALVAERFSRAELF